MRQVRRVVPATLTALALTFTSGAAFAATVGSTPVGTIVTSSWTPTSPDPSGVIYNPSTDELLVSDGEVDEMPLYAGSNLYQSSLTGAGAGSGTTVPWSNEPTGIGFDRETGRLFISDDDKKSIFIIAGAGSDGRFGTSDDGGRTTFKTSVFGNTDPEDVAYDTQRDQLLLVDGVGAKWFTLTPGADGIFNGVAPGGDDVATEFDLLGLGAEDPEGIAYDEVRDTVLIVDGSADKIFELDFNGSLLNEIDLADADIVKAAGITLAPASTGTGRHYYIADRGLDNNSHPEENDGLIHELSADLPPITNRPPAANAGVDILMDLPETATLTGSAVDDGVPTGTLSYSWSKLSGPGDVTLGTASAASTTATFSATGTYVLRLTVSDSQLTDFDDVTVNVFAPGAVRTVTLPIVSGADDAQEGGGSAGTFVDLSSADNELGNDGPPTPETMLTGLRFANIPVPAGGQIVGAKIQFKVDEGGSDPTNLVIRGESSDNAAGYIRQAGNISTRPSTTATVSWAPPAWSLIGEAGPDQATPDLSAILQEIVSRPGWQEGNAAAFMINGTGRRTAEAKDGLAPPVLVLDFRTSAPVSAPVVNAGTDATVTLPDAAALDGTVTVDGQPAPSTTATTWSMVSGPGTVTFGDATLQDTTATFSAPGVYTLQLTANDTDPVVSDDVVITVQDQVVNVAPTVSAGTDSTVTLPGTAALDGTVTDDGLPAPATLTSTWTEVSGPGTVTFGNASAVDTTAAFSQAGVYTLRLPASDSALTAQDEVVVTVQEAATTGPTVVGRSPAPDATGVSRGTNVDITFDRAMRATSINTNTVKLRRVSTGGIVSASVSYAGTDRRARINPSSNLAAGEVFQVELSSGIRDTTGRQLVAETWRFTTVTATDTVAPRISGRSPAAGATGVSRTANVLVTFSEPVTGVSGTSVTLTRVSNGSRVSAVVTYDASRRRATLNPSVTLAGNVRYRVAVSNQIKDLAGNSLASTSWRFTTRG